LATGVVVTDTVPDNTTFNAAESLPTAWNCLPDNSAGSICTTAVADVPPAGGTGQVFFAVTVDNPLPAGVDTILNAAVVGDDGRKGPDPTPENNRDNEETPLRGNLRLGNRIWLDTNENGLLDDGETGPEGVVIELYRQGGASNFELFALTETSDDGEYGFSDLPAGNYYVLLTAQNFSNSQSPLYNQVSSDPIVTDANTNIDNDNNGLQATDPLSTGIRSSLVALAVGTEPTGEAGEDGLVPDNNSNLTIDFALRPSSGTAVDLLYFQGVYRNGQVDLTWETAIEYDNFGFRLLRSETGDLADAVEIASVPGKGYGTQNGAVYDYTDNAVASKRVYTYWLIDVDLNGIETTHQPVVIVTNNGIFLPLVRR
jgi:hypothetical protein